MAVFIQTVSDAKQSFAQLQEQLFKMLESSRKTAVIRSGEVRDQGVVTIGQPILRVVRSLPIKTISKPAEQKLTAWIKSTTEPFANYDEFTAKEVVSKLRNADPYTVSKVSKYESANKNRKTILRAI